MWKGMIRKYERKRKKKGDARVNLQSKYMWDNPKYILEDMEEKEGLDVDVEISGAFSNQLSPLSPHYPLQTMIIFMKMLTNSSILILKTSFQFNDEKIWIFTKKERLIQGRGSTYLASWWEKYLDRDAKVSQLFLIKWYNKPDEIYSCSTKHFFYILQMNCDSN